MTGVPRLMRPLKTRLLVFRPGLFVVHAQKAGYDE